MFEASLSDPSNLKRLSGVLQWIAIGLVFCGGFVQVLRLIVDQRERAISREIATDKENEQQDREAALRADLEASKANLEAVATRDIFRPLASAARVQLIAELRLFRQALLDVPLKIEVYTEAGSRNRMLFTSELVGILRESGIDATESGSGTTFATGALPPIALELSEASLPIADALVKRLDFFIKTDFAAQRSEAPLGAIAMRVYGDPQFDAQGLVSFR